MRLVGETGYEAAVWLFCARTEIHENTKANPTITPVIVRIRVPFLVENMIHQKYPKV